MYLYYRVRIHRANNRAQHDARPTDDHLEIRKHFLIVPILCYPTCSTFPSVCFIAFVFHDDDDEHWPAKRTAIEECQNAICNFRAQIAKPEREQCRVSVCKLVAYVGAVLKWMEILDCDCASSSAPRK